MNSNINFMKYGESILQSVLKHFWDSKKQYAKEELADPPESETAFLWPYSAFIEMIYEYYKVEPSEKNFYITTLEVIEKYRQTRDDGLDAYTAAYGGYEDAYYDDNAWIVNTFIIAHKTLGGSEWLEKAKKTMEYCYSGWDSKLGGGVYWRECDKLCKCLCSNAPLALFSLDLYKETSDEKYLNWALKLYKWSKKNFWESNGIYPDSVNLDGEIDRTKYPYNTAFMIRLELALYKITGNPTYLLNAEFSGHASFPCFCSPGEDGKLKLKEGDRPWFYMCLLETYMELYRISEDKGKYLGYIDSMANEVERAYRTCQNEDGFVSPDWWTEGGPAPENIQIRDQSAISKIMFLLAAFYKEIN